LKLGEEKKKRQQGKTFQVGPNYERQAKKRSASKGGTQLSMLGEVFRYHRCFGGETAKEEGGAKVGCQPFCDTNAKREGYHHISEEDSQRKVLGPQKGRGKRGDRLILYGQGREKRGGRVATSNSHSIIGQQNLGMKGKGESGGVGSVPGGLKKGRKENRGKKGRYKTTFYLQGRHRSWDIWGGRARREKEGGIQHKTT